MHHSATERLVVLAGTAVLLLAAWTSPARAAACLRISEVDVDTQTVTLTNVGDAPQPGGYWLCNFPAYDQVNQSVAAGASISVTFASLATDDGEVGLYSDTSFGSASSMMDYMQYGPGSHTRAGVAVQAGVWGSTTDAVTVPPTRVMTWNGTECGQTGVTFWESTTGITPVRAESFGTMKHQFE